MGNPPGGPCFYSTECQYGYYCASGNNITGVGVCTKRIPLGQPCAKKGNIAETSVCDSDLSASCGPDGTCIAAMSVPVGGGCTYPVQCMVDHYCKHINNSKNGTCTPAAESTPCTLDGDECYIAGGAYSYCQCTSAGVLLCAQLGGYFSSPCTPLHYTNYVNCMDAHQCQSQPGNIDDPKSCARRFCYAELSCFEYCFTTIGSHVSIALGCTYNDPRFTCGFNTTTGGNATATMVSSNMVSSNAHKTWVLWMVMMFTSSFLLFVALW